jgi:thymidylate kinase
VPDRLFVTLSGVVGAGKSSAAAAIVRGLEAAGCRAKHVRFQDFIGSRGRQPPASAHQIETPLESGQATRWQNYRRRPLTRRIAAGHALRTLLFRFRARQSSGTVLVFDRYFYDSLAHFELQNAGPQLELLLRMIPKPDACALLLVRESTILQRRPRYSTEYARLVSAGYESLATRLPGAIVAQTDEFEEIADVASRVVAAVLELRREEKSGVATDRL